MNSIIDINLILTQPHLAYCNDAPTRYDTSSETQAMTTPYIDTGFVTVTVTAEMKVLGKIE